MEQEKSNLVIFRTQLASILMLWNILRHQKELSHTERSFGSHAFDSEASKKANLKMHHPKT